MPKYTKKRWCMNVLLNLCTGGFWSFWSETRNYNTYK
jgi:hypothetical protein